MSVSKETVPTRLVRFRPRTSGSRTRRLGSSRRRLGRSSAWVWEGKTVPQSFWVGIERSAGRKCRLMQVTFLLDESLSLCLLCPAMSAHDVWTRMLDKHKCCSLPSSSDFLQEPLAASNILERGRGYGFQHWSKLLFQHTLTAPNLRTHEPRNQHPQDQYSLWRLEQRKR